MKVTISDPTGKNSESDMRVILYDERDNNSTGNLIQVFELDFPDSFTVPVPNFSSESATTWNEHVKATVDDPDKFITDDMVTRSLVVSHSDFRLLGAKRGHPEKRLPAPPEVRRQHRASRAQPRRPRRQEIHRVLQRPRHDQWRGLRQRLRPPTSPSPRARRTISSVSTGIRALTTCSRSTRTSRAISTRGSPGTSTAPT